MQKAHLLKDALELVKVKQSDGTSRYTIKPLDAELSFDKGFYVFIRAIQLLTQHNKDTILVRTGREAAAGEAASAAATGSHDGERRQVEPSKPGRPTPRMLLLPCPAGRPGRSLGLRQDCLQ